VHGPAWSTTCSHRDGTPEEIEQIASQSPDSGHWSRKVEIEGREKLKILLVSTPESKIHYEWQLYPRQCRHARHDQGKEMMRENEIEDALPGATRLREKHSLCRFRNHGIVKGKKKREDMHAHCESTKYWDRLPLENQQF